MRWLPLLCTALGAVGTPASAAAHQLSMNSCAVELENFQAFLTSISPRYWSPTFRENTLKFEDFVTMLSDYMLSCNSKFQFISVGACDGTSDPMIRMFYSSKNWNGLFIEASPPNIKYLREKLVEERSLDRSYILHAAAMEYCSEPTIEFARPLVEEQNGTDAKHWVRRQVGRVPKSADAVRWFKRKSSSWALDKVPCMIAKDVYRDWEQHSPVSTRTPGNSHRVHLLKIDVERWSIPVMKSFLSFAFPISELPVMVMAELKTSPGDFEEDCREVTGFLEARGYIVAKCGQDILAMLRPEHIL